MIPVTTLQVTAASAGPIDFGSNPGSSIRGALYEALRAMYDTHQPVQGRDDDEANPVAWLLALEDEATTGGKDVPRPIAVRPPLENDRPGAEFGLSFIGRGRAYIPMVLSAVQAMGRIGVGRGRGTFEVREVLSVDPLTGQTETLLDRNGQQVGRIPEPASAEAYQQAAEGLAAGRLTVRFLTPTRIVNKGSLCSAPEFRPWVQRLLERTRQLGELYTDAPPWIAFPDLLADADRVRLAVDETHWVEAWSGSRRQNARRPTSGFVGRVVYEDVSLALMPWLLLGQGLQVGKNTVKGCGWYRVST